MGQGIAAFGTLLKIGDGGGPENFTTIAEVRNIDGPGLSLAPIDVTSHDSASAFMEFVAGLRDGGEITLELNYVPSNATHGNTTGLIRDLRQGTKRNFKLVFPDTAVTTWSITALVTGFRPGAPHDGKLSASTTLKLSGVPTLV